VASAVSASAEAGASGALPELATVPWRPRVTERSLRRTGWLWTFTTVAHTIPFLGAAGWLFTINPITVPIGVVILAHAWAIPELYAARGANVVRLRGVAGRDPEERALLLLGDLVDQPARELHGRSGLVLERGHLGTWLIGEAGAVLVRPGGRRVHCYCVRATDRTLPSSDKIGHLLLAVRADETGFATVANLAFSGARWRLRRRLPERTRIALDAAAARP
jgi:hypothetical protein